MQREKRQNRRIAGLTKSATYGALESIENLMLGNAHAGDQMACSKLKLRQGVSDSHLSLSPSACVEEEPEEEEAALGALYSSVGKGLSTKIFTTVPVTSPRRMPSLPSGPPRLSIALQC